MAIVITNDKALARREVIIKSTHRGLLYQDGVLVRVLEAGRYVLPGRLSSPFLRRPRVEVVLVDVRERELTIKGQEILTSDKVAIRVSIVVQFRVTDPAAALQQVAEYEDRLYSDVQLAARRSLASMTLEDILADVLGAAASYGVQILRADVKDLIFPGNLQEIMNRVLATERLSQAELVQARTKAEAQRIDAEAKAEARRLEAAAEVERQRLAAEAEAEAERIRTAAEVDAVRQREQIAQIFSASPALLRLRELETLRELAQVANARIYIGFPKHVRADADGVDRD